MVDFENSRLTKEQHDQIESLKVVEAAGSHVDSATALFHEIDADGSGELDETEFGHLLESIGIKKYKI